MKNKIIKSSTMYEMSGTVIADFLKLHPEVKDECNAGLDGIIILASQASMYTKTFGKYVYGRIKSSDKKFNLVVIFSPQNSSDKIIQRMLYDVLGIKDKKYLKNIKSLGDESKSLIIKVGKVEYSFTLQTIRGQKYDVTTHYAYSKTEEELREDPQFIAAMSDYGKYGQITIAELVTPEETVEGFRFFSALLPFEEVFKQMLFELDVTDKEYLKKVRKLKDGKQSLTVKFEDGEEITILVRKDRKEQLHKAASRLS